MTRATPTTLGWALRALAALAFVWLLVVPPAPTTFATKTSDAWGAVTAVNATFAGARVERATCKRSRPDRADAHGHEGMPFMPTSGASLGRGWARVFVVDFVASREGVARPQLRVAVARGPPVAPAVSALPPPRPRARSRVVARGSRCPNGSRERTRASSSQVFSMNKQVSSQSSTPASAPFSTRLPSARRAAGYTSTLLGVICMMVAAGALGDGDPKHPPTSPHRAAGWVGLGGSALFLTTGFRLLRERSEEPR